MHARVAHLPARLQSILEQWGQLSQAAQQDVYEEAVVVARDADWDELEARLQQALDNAA